VVCPIGRPKVIQRGGCWQVLQAALLYVGVCPCFSLSLYSVLHACCSLQAINRHTEAEMQYNGVVDAVKRMLADEGVAGFYKGKQGSTCVYTRASWCQSVTALLAAA
jgi:hypothetical protein